MRFSTLFHILFHSTNPAAETHEDATSLASRFRAFLDPEGTRDKVAAGLLARFDELEAAVERLTEREVAHDVAWTEARDQISRHLKRVLESERRQGRSGGIDAITQRVLDLKFPKRESAG